MSFTHAFRAGLAFGAAVAITVVTNACTTSQAAKVTPVGDPNDAEIATTGLTLNEKEVEQSQLAVQRASTPEVKSYAERMVKEHGRAIEETRELMKEAGYEQQPIALTRGLEVMVENKTGSLRNKSGMEFDREYMDAQIELHKATIETIRDDFLPNASNPELRSYLQETEEKIEARLRDAEQLRARLDETA